MSLPGFRRQVGRRPRPPLLALWPRQPRLVRHRPDADEVRRAHGEELIEGGPVQQTDDLFVARDDAAQQLAQPAVQLRVRAQGHEPHGTIS